MDDNLNRFIRAQKENYNIALQEIKEGYKKSHFMWYIFPQLKGLGSSYMAEYYGIKDLKEAKEYLDNKYLRDNLLKMCDVLLSLKERDIRMIMDYPDDLKLRSSMTLFSYADPLEKRFRKVLEKYFAGEEDELTIDLLEKKKMLTEEM